MYTNLGLVDHAKQALNDGWGYVYGTWGNVCTESLLQQKKAQYPANVVQFEDFIRTHWMGRVVADCVGLIKSYYWEQTDGTRKYDGNTDVSANGMYSKASEKGDIGSIPEIPGLCVQKDGHIGVYIGNGEVIESRGTKAGVIKSTLTSNNPGWQHWLKCPFIQYIEETTVSVSNELNIPGIDVSHWDGECDFSKIKDSGIQIVYMKATQETDHIDEKLEEYYSDTSKAGLKLGFYHYFIPKNEDDARAQAQFFYNAVKDKHADCLYMLDVEDANGVERDTLSNLVKTCLEEIKRLIGKEVILYTGEYFYNHSLNGDILQPYKVWVAKYSNTRPDIGKYYYVWQYTSTGTVSGINGNVDLDWFSEGIYLDKQDCAQPSQPATSQSNDNPIAEGKAYVGSRCLELQQKLNKIINAGLLDKPLLDEDNDFGKLSYEKTVLFQTKYNLTIDGKTGTQTFSKLDELIAQINKPQPQSQPKVDAILFKQSVLLFQKACNSMGIKDDDGHKLDEDGKLGVHTTQCLRKALVRRGDKNPLVGVIQTILHIKVDNVYGNAPYHETYDAIGSFQSSKGLGVDHMVGSKTWTALLSI